MVDEHQSRFDRGTRFGELFDHLALTAPYTSLEHIGKLRRSAFHNDYARHSRPVIFTSESSPRQVDVLDLLGATYPDYVVKVRHGDYVNPENYAPEKRKLMDLSLAKYIELLGVKHGGSTPPYAGNFTLPLAFLETLGAGIPSFYDAGLFEPPTVWLGAAGCITPLHRDSSDNFAIQLKGRKRWTIFAPQDAPYLYMSSVSASKGGDFATSAVDLRSPDLSVYPLFTKATPITFELNEGETLYLPMGWAHYVENVEISLMVNHWLSVVPLGIAALQFK